MAQSRKSIAFDTRVEAAKLASDRARPAHRTNNEEFEYRDHSSPDAAPSHLANYTKGLPHDADTGLLLNPLDYKLLVIGIQSGDPMDFQHTPLGPAIEPSPTIPNTPSTEAITSTTLQRDAIWKSDIAQKTKGDDFLPTETGARVRAWESAGAGNVLDLEGPDAQAVTMPPAPRLDSDELFAEMAEVYAMSLQRDVPFAAFPLADGTDEPGVNAAQRKRRLTAEDKPKGRSRATSFDNLQRMLCQLDWFTVYNEDGGYTPEQIARRRFLENESDVFRGNTPGERLGPYLSQFLLLGNRTLGDQDASGNSYPSSRSPVDGFIMYGGLGIQQKIRKATPFRDYMTTWSQYLDVQNGADLRGAETYVPPSELGDQGHRFITTPRDLATYVHYDALYEAYLNACLYLLAAKAPFDRGLPFLESDTFDKQQGFAHFGGPHILTLVCETATRALKAVRYQKFNVHRRLRPEAVAARVDRYIKFSKQRGSKLADGLFAPAKPLTDQLKRLEWEPSKELLNVICDFNHKNNKNEFPDEQVTGDSYLLPMAFPEGSPMHPSYGAGHGTVAGACVTILKAYFDHGWTPKDWKDDGKAIAYEPNVDGSSLTQLTVDRPLTIEGELNKLAANIAIGRNWAGVHYYSDYIESMRLGERIALGVLEEQKLTYPENFTMTVPLFDGGAVRI